MECGLSNYISCCRLPVFHGDYFCPQKSLSSGGDGTPVELFQILKDDAVKVLHSICQQIWKTQQWPQDWKMSVSFQSQRKAMPKNAQSTAQLQSSHMLAGEGNGTPLQYSCLENPVDGGAWWAAVHGVAGSRTRLSDFIFTFHFRALEKETATHSTVLAWRIPGTGEPGGLPSAVTQSRTRLKRLSSSSSSSRRPLYAVACLDSLV